MHGCVSVNFSDKKHRHPCPAGMAHWLSTDLWTRSYKWEYLEINNFYGVSGVTSFFCTSMGRVPSAEFSLSRPVLPKTTATVLMAMPRIPEHLLGTQVPAERETGGPHLSCWLSLRRPQESRVSRLEDQRCLSLQEKKKNATVFPALCGYLV